MSSSTSSTSSTNTSFNPSTWAPLWSTLNTTQQQKIYTILRNLVEHPGETKYTRINRIKVTPSIGAAGVSLLDQLGFKDTDGSGLLIISSPAPAYAAYEWINTQQFTERHAIRAQRDIGIAKLEANAGVTGQGGDGNAYEKKVASLPAEPVTLKSLKNELIFWHNHNDQLRTRLSLYRSLTTEHHRYIQEKQSSSPLPLPHYRTAFDTIWSQPASYRDRVWRDLHHVIERMVKMWEKAQRESANSDHPATISLTKETYFPILNQTPGTLTALESLGIAIGETTFFLPADVPIQRLRDALAYMSSKHDDKHTDRLKSLDRLAAKAKPTSTTPANSTMARENAEMSKVEQEKAKLEQEMNAVKEKIDVQKKEAEELKQSIAPLEIEFGRIHVMEWSVPLWAGKEINIEYSCHPLVIDPQERKWRGYVKKQQKGKISLFLECMAKKSSPHLPCLVTMHASILHYLSKSPCERPFPETTHYYQQVQFSLTDNKLGWLDFGTTERFQQYGGYESKDDTCSFRLVFAVKEIEKPTTTRVTSKSEIVDLDLDHALATSTSEKETSGGTQKAVWSLSHS